MTKQNLLNDLKILNSKMLEIADKIEKIYPNSENSKELKGAAAQIFSWASDLEDEICEGKK